VKPYDPGSHTPSDAEIEAKEREDLADELNALWEWLRRTATPAMGYKGHWSDTVLEAAKKLRGT
jgi:hypothetical protein